MTNLITLITAAGYVGITLVVFAESGLLIGFFLPGDSLLFTAGLLASKGHLSILLLLPLCFIAAVVGDSTGYAFGKKLGPKIFTRDESLFFKRAYVEKTRAFFAKYGDKAVVLARFMPVVRTFVPVFAGVGEMSYVRFLAYNVIGGALWVSSMLGLGYILGETIPDIDRYVFPIIIVIILASILPGIIAFIRDRRATPSL